MRKIFYLTFILFLLLCCSNKKNAGDLHDFIKEKKGQEKYTELYVVDYLYKNGKWDMENGDTTFILNYEYDENGRLTKKIFLKNWLAEILGQAGEISEIIYKYEGNMVISETYSDASKKKIPYTTKKFQDDKGRDTLVLGYYNGIKSEPDVITHTKYDHIGLLNELRMEGDDIDEVKRLGQQPGILINQNMSKDKEGISYTTDTIWLDADNKPQRKRYYSDRELTEETFYKNGKIVEVISFSDGNPEKKTVNYYK